MSRRNCVALMVCSILLVGLMSTDVQAIEILTKEDFVNKVVVSNHLVKTADNAIILFDTSDSMTKMYLDSGMSRYDAARKMLAERNMIFPDLGHNIGLYTYGPWKAYYPVQPYNREKFAEALASLPEKPTGATSIQWALRELDPILATLSGKTVVFLISDGTYTPERKEYVTDVPGIAPNAPKNLAKKLTSKYNVCFCMISTADDEESKAVLYRMAEVSACSMAIPFETFMLRPEYNSGLLFAVKSTADVITTTETRVTGAKVGDILFSYDQYSIESDAAEALKKLGVFMREHQETYAVIAGYTCGLGTEAYNMTLSKNRAQSAAKYLENQMKIDPARLVTLWYGKLNPVGDNNTEEGRIKNRRVEIAIGGMEDK